MCVLVTERPDPETSKNQPPIHPKVRPSHSQTPEGSQRDGNSNFDPYFCGFPFFLNNPIPKDPVPARNLRAYEQIRGDWHDLSKTSKSGEGIVTQGSNFETRSSSTIDTPLLLSRSRHTKLSTTRRDDTDKQSTAMLLYVRRVTAAFWVELVLRSGAISLLFICLWLIMDYDADIHGPIVKAFYPMTLTMLACNTVLYIRAATLQIVRYRLGELPEDPIWGRNLENFFIFFIDFTNVMISSLGPLCWILHLNTLHKLTPEEVAKCRPYPHTCAVMDYRGNPNLQKVQYIYFIICFCVGVCCVLDFCQFLWAVKIRRCRPDPETRQSALMEFLG
ncbi:hypothetical protein V8F20_004036 [Naviculisporaceae sp. PSN 640]